MRRNASRSWRWLSEQAPQAPRAEPAASNSARHPGPSPLACGPGERPHQRYWQNCKIMALAKRIIPCLDVTAGRVVKGVNFVELRDAGDPVELAARYDLEGADEVVFLDITASSDERDTMVEVWARTAEQVFTPITVGGGIRTVDDARRLLR